VHDRHQQQPDGLAEVDERANFRMAQDGAGVAEVRQDDAGGAAAGQQRVRMDVDDRVVVHVGHPGTRRDLRGDLVHVPGGRDARADVDDLPYPRLGGQEPHRPLQERPVSPRGVPVSIASLSAITSPPAIVDPARESGKMTNADSSGHRGAWRRRRLTI
jgi:hypothetical protein